MLSPANFNTQSWRLDHLLLRDAIGTSPRNETLAFADHVRPLGNRTSKVSGVDVLVHWYWAADRTLHVAASTLFNVTLS